MSWWEGTLAARPAAGQPNRFYKATDTGQLFHDTGATWEAIIVKGGAGNYAALKSYTKAECEAGVEPSATRYAFVLIFCETLPAMTIGGVLVLGPKQTCGYIIPPGQRWKTDVAANTTTLLL